jgi:signal transduction histidine kinase
VRAETSLTETNLRLMTLRQVDAELNRKLDVHYVADIAIDAAMRVTLGDAAVLGLKEEEGIRIIRALGPYPPDLMNSLLPEDQSITARVVHSKEAVFIPDISQTPDYRASAPNMRAQISVPLLSGRKLIGVITIETADPTRFTSEVFETLKLLAAHVATAIDNAYSYEEREKLVKELEAFSRTVAHDLKNPLSSVIGYAELAVDNYDRLDDEQKKSFLEIILRNGQKSVDIINALLLLARVRRDQEVQFTDLNTTRIVEEVRVRLQPMIEEFQAELILPAAWPVATGYAPWVEEIWANYVSNAIKYGGSPPRVELGGDELPDGKVRFWVRDNGVGLSKEDQSKLFRIFTRLGQSDASGHGLGLSIVESIAERLKGQVGVESEVGQGSLFYFILPAGGRVETKPIKPVTGV